MSAGENAFCEKIGRDCESRRVCLIAKADWAKAADWSEKSNSSVFANIGRFVSGILPFTDRIGKIPVEEAESKRDQYDRLLKEPCKGEECVAERALFFN